MTTFPATTSHELRDHRCVAFAFEVHGADVVCYVSEAAINQWCNELCCDRANVQRLRRIAHEVVAAAMPRAAVTAEDRWTARVGVHSVTLTISED